MRLYLHMVKQVLVKLIQCEDSRRSSSCECVSTNVFSIIREGFHRGDNIESRGIIPRAIEQVFGHIQNHASPRRRFLVRASYLQIYNEQVIHC